MRSKNFLFYFLGLSLLGIMSSAFISREKPTQNEMPNILFIIADDWSYPHASIYDDEAVQTPHFDRIAREGLLFDNAFVSSPSCTPSRAAVVTGQHFWRLKEGANLYGSLPASIPTYPELLTQKGYHVGHTDKGWGPGTHADRPFNPAGPKFADFKSFLNKREKNNPFCFWFGSLNPHRGYKKDAGVEAGIDLDAIYLPAAFPESDVIRKDVADYYKEVQDFDTEIGELLKELETIGELDNTLIIVTSDNGMPFPRCKSNLYDMGTRVPLAIRWGNKIKSPKRLDDFISLTDMAPTFLELAGIPIPTEMTGQSLVPLLNSKALSKNRTYILSGKERHVPGQELNDAAGYPMRAIRTKDFLYIKNFSPDRWPSGTPDYNKAYFYPAYYADVDGGPTRTYMIAEKAKDRSHEKRFSLAFEKRPAEELYDLSIDPDQLINVAKEPAYAKERAELERQLLEALKQTKDPRINGDVAVFETSPYSGGTPFPDDFRRSNANYATVKIEGFPSKYIGSRTIEILTPVNVTHDTAFEVLYMFDGQNLFHSFKGWGGEQNEGWQVDEILNKLHKEEQFPKMIVVGIFNGKDRQAEYMPAKPASEVQKRIASSSDPWEQTLKMSAPKSDQQLQFIVEELKPYVDANFKTKKDRASTFVAGSSMGGLMAAYAICEYPEVFGGAACLSTHWPILNGVFLEYIQENLPDPATHKIYFDFGTEGLDGDYEPFQKKADAAMEKAGYKKGTNWNTLKFEGAKHHEEDWNKRLDIPLRFLLENK